MKYSLTILTWLWVLLCTYPARGNPGEIPNNDSKTILTTLNAPPGPGFTYVANGGCAPVVVQFTAQMAGPSYNWNFGDATPNSTACNPVHVYTNPGTYTVTLVATGGTYSTTITVGAVPVVTFGGAQFACLGDMKPYTASSTIPAATWSWQVQGGSVTGVPTATGANITWTSYGLNKIIYTITTAAGCTKVFTYDVKVIPPPTVNLPCCDKRQNPDGTANPAANPEPGHENVPGGGEPCDVCAGSYECYEGTVPPDFGLASDYTWQWSVTNGVIDTLYPDSTKVCVIWGASGTGTIKVTLTHKIYGCQTVRECEVTIKPGITPVFNVNGTCVNWPVNFDASATTPISDIESYFWEFGDGYTQQTFLPFTSHKYDFVGTYTATLTIKTKEGCEYKITKTFVVTSGTRPIIVCPGTVCEGSRQCYSTTLISGASYAWTITGHVPGSETISADGNQICVTWGNGPVGTVTVAVTGGGYTCGNTSTEAVAIVGSVIPIEGPDYICQTATWTEVSTTNYTGACYRWTVNGVAQASATNVLMFNAALFSSPITVKVAVDFPLGCCHGEGVKIIKKIPEYGMFPFQTNVCIGSTWTYTMNFPAGNPSSPVSWEVEGGTVNWSNANQINITWTTAGPGTITAGNNTPTEYCNDGSNNTWTVTVWNKATGEDISGEQLVCQGQPVVYYHGFEAPTNNVIVSVSPSAGVSVVTAANRFSSTITFPVTAAPVAYTISVTYTHSIAQPSPCGVTKTYVVNAVPPTIPVFTLPPGNVCEGDIKVYTAPMANPAFYDVSVQGGAVLSQTWAAGITTLTVQWASTINSSITVTNKACGTSNTQIITVNGRPVVIISVGGMQCGVSSRSLSVAPVWASYAWSAGVVPNNAPSGNISAPGTYSVTISNGVCTNTGSVNVPIVSPLPPDLTSFTVTPPPVITCPKIYKVCGNINPGTGTISAHNWSFTGFTVHSIAGNCAYISLPTSPGLHTGTWKLVIVDAYNCKDSLTGTLTDSCQTNIIPPCPLPYAATFNYIGYDPCTGQFNSSATNYTSVSWNFGDGSYGSGLTPTYFYATAGCPRTAVVTVTDINGCPKSFTVSVNVPYAFGVPQVNVASAPCTGATTLTAVGLSKCGAVTEDYDWVITPVAGGPSVSILNATVNTLNVASLGLAPGNYNVTVTMSFNGCIKTIAASNTFNVGGLQAFFLSCGGCAGTPLSLTDQSSPYQAPIIKWEWNFVTAGITSFLQNPSVTLPAGLHTVSLKVTDNNLCTHTYTTTINITSPPPLGDIKVNGSPTPNGTTLNVCPGTYTLEAPTHVTATSWLWSDGVSGQIRPVTQQGDYSVTIFTSGGCKIVKGPIKFRFKPAPAAIIEPSGDACSPRLLRAFKGTGYTYSWTTPSGTFTGPYVYLSTSGNVTLTVTNLHGCTATVTQFFNVLPTPSVGLNYAPQPFCPNTTVTLTATVSGGTPAYHYLWNNGVNGIGVNTISVSTPGLYIVTVTDVNGCDSKASYNLQPVLPSGMDKLPYGCYDVCGPVTFCAGGTMPFGWTGQWYNGAVPYGAPIPQGGSIAVTFTASGTYTLKYIPVNPSTHCPATSKPITINVIALPNFTITASEPIICVNGGGVLLTANPQDPQYSYEWFLNGNPVPVGTGYTYTATVGGTYTLVVSKNPCCKKEVDITFEEVICCFDDPNLEFEQVLADITLPGNTVWDGKWYVDATITVPSGVIFDITNTDVVFSRRGRIIFLDGSFFRCNNSVLRPCFKDDIWPGMQFHGTAAGWINTTTIKNAEIAADMLGNQAGVRFTDNSFIKCQTSIWYRDSRKQASVSGNAFEIDDTQLSYPSASNQYFAIRMDGTEMSGLISQNEFRHVNPQKAGNVYFGIYSRSSTFTASENYFNDMYRSIDVSGNYNVVAIEKNDIKINTLKETYDRYQIRITDIEVPVLVYENKLDNSLGDNSSAGGIYCERTYRTHIKDNKINGFRYSIYAVRTRDIHIASNEITSSSSIGISTIDCDRSHISCNILNSMATNGSQFGGNPLYGIMDWDGREDYIWLNCISNMHDAMHLYSGNGFQLPTIINNFMYNYWDNGIYNDGYNGSIGNPGGATAAGRNTFMSNNGATGSTFDINSVSTFINEGGNFGIMMTNNVGSTTGTDEYYSTAACGQQIEPTYRNNQLDRYNICDVYYLEQWVERNPDGKFVLKTPTREITAGYISEQLKAGKTEVLGEITAKMLTGTEPAKRTADAVFTSSMDKNLAAKVVINAALGNDDAKLAAGLLASPQLNGINDDLRKVLEISIAVADKQELTASQAGVLAGIDNKDNEYSPMARDIIHSWNAEHDYKFRSVPQPQHKTAANPLAREINSIVVYPVPATDEITIRHTVRDAKVLGVKIVSAIGAEVANFNYTLQAGEVTVDVSSLADGVYSVILVTDSKEKAMMTGRFIKIR